MFKNTFYRPGTSNQHSPFRKLFPKGRALIVNVNTKADGTRYFMQAANAVCEVLTPWADAFCVSMREPRKKTALSDWQATLALVASSLLARGAIERPIGISVPAKYFEHGFAAARLAGCQFLYLDGFDSNNPAGSMRHHYLDLREKNPELIVLVGFSTVTAEETPIAMSAARAKAMSDGVVLAGTTELAIPGNCDLRTARETVLAFPLLASAPLTAQDVMDMPSLEGIVTTFVVDRTLVSLMSFQKNVQQLHRALSQR